MNIKAFTKRYLRVIAGAAFGIVLGLLGTSVVKAAIPDTNGMINGCYSTGLLGMFKIIASPSETCSLGQTAISWEKQAPSRGRLAATLTNSDFGAASFAYQDLRNLNMSGSSFAEANFNGAVFTGTTMTNLTVDEATFSNTNFGGINFSGSTLSKVLIHKTNFANANLSNTNFHDVLNASGSSHGSSQPVQTGATFNGANLTNAQFAVELIDGDFRNVILSNAQLTINLHNSNAQGVDFRSVADLNMIAEAGANLTSANFSGMSLAGVLTVDAANISSANFSNTDLLGVYITGSTAASTNFNNASFEEGSFEGTNLSSATLTGTTWVNTICPDGTNSNDHSNTCSGHLVP